MKRRNFVKQSIAGGIITSTPLALSSVVEAAGVGPRSMTLSNTIQPETTRTTVQNFPCVKTSEKFIQWHDGEQYCVYIMQCPNHSSGKQYKSEKYLCDPACSLNDPNTSSGAIIESENWLVCAERDMV